MSQYQVESPLQKRRKRQDRHNKNHPKRPARARSPQGAGSALPEAHTPPPADLTLPVEVLTQHGVLRRTTGALHAKGVTTLSDLTAKTADDLRELGIRQGSLDKIVSALKARGLRLKPKSVAP